jgi:hypothetical protein
MWIPQDQKRKEDQEGIRKTMEEDSKKKKNEDCLLGIC